MLRILFVLLIVSPLSGCGTLCNLPDQPGMFHLNGAPTRRLYGGVRLDADSGVHCIADAITRPELESGVTFCMGAYTLLIDLPCSFVGDTVTLPYVLYLGPGKPHFLWATQETGQHAEEEK